MVIAYLERRRTTTPARPRAWSRTPAAGPSLVPADLVEEEACQALVDRAVDELGRIDILVNNAAYQMAQPGGIADITTEQFDRVMKTNLYAMFWLCKMALPHMQPGATHHQHLVGAGVLALARSCSTTPPPRPAS